MAEMPIRFEQLETIGDAIKTGKEVSPALLNAMNNEIMALLAKPEVMAHVDLTNLVKASSNLLTFDVSSVESSSTNADIEAQRYVALLLDSIGASQSYSGKNYQSAPDEVILKPLLILASNWIALIDNLKSKGADAWAPNYSGGVKILDGAELSDEAKAMVAKDTKLRELIPLNVRLNVVTHYLRELSETVKSSVDRLKAASKTTFVTKTIAASGITQARFDQLLQLGEEHGKRSVNNSGLINSEQK